MFGDIVDYEKGETPMTDYQFKQYEAYRAKCEALEKEVALLRQKLSTFENGGSGESGMTNYQFKSFLETLYKTQRAYFEAGKCQEEILSAIDDLIKRYPNG